MHPLSNIQPRPKLTKAAKKAKIQNKATGWDPPKECNLQKSTKTIQKAAPAKKAQNSKHPFSKIQPRPTELNREPPKKCQDPPQKAAAAKKAAPAKKAENPKD